MNKDEDFVDEDFATGLITAPPSDYNLSCISSFSRTTYLYSLLILKRKRFKLGENTLIKKYVFFKLYLKYILCLDHK